MAQNEEDHRDADHRDADHREAVQDEEAQSAVLHREADQREADQRVEVAQVSPVQVEPSHLPPDQAVLLEVAAHQVAGRHGTPCTSISPVRATPAASRTTESPRAAAIDPCPVDLGKDWIEAARLAVAVVLPPSILEAVT